MDTATAPGGARASFPGRVTLQQQVRDTAAQLQHIAALALICADAGTDEGDAQGATHLLDGLAELAPRLKALSAGRTL